MKQYYLTEIITKDDLIHAGIYFAPLKKGKRAILWVHGLSATFYGSIPITDAFCDACEKESMGFAMFNNRGHDLLAGIRKVDPSKPRGFDHYPAGAGEEVFEESVLDIDAGVKFLLKQGYKEIIIVGHSTGANKLCYWAATQKNPHVVGVVLSGPISDRLSPTSKKYWYLLPYLRFLTWVGLGNKLISGVSFFPATPKRLLSLLSPTSTEDVFDYGDNYPKLELFSKIVYPLMVIIGGNDDVADRPVRDIKKVFDAKHTVKKYHSVIIPGGTHTYTSVERAAVKAIIDWIKTL